MCGQSTSLFQKGQITVVTKAQDGDWYEQG
jgi:hypothetical protein